MHDQKSYINRLLDSVGTETFIKYFQEFNFSKRDKLITLFEKNNEPWNKNSIGQKTSNGKRIFEEHLELEALEHIILKKRENNIPNGSWVKKRAKEIYKDYVSTTERHSELAEISRTEKEILIKYRLQQGQFRKNLLLYWEGCSVTDCKNGDLLIASHIKPYSESDDDEKYDTNNGLLLTPNFDKLFDRYLISFENNGKIMLSSILEKNDLESLRITGNEILKVDKLTAAIQRYLGHHRQKFELKGSKNR